MKKTVLFMIFGLLISTVCHAKCPADKPIKWLNDQCLSCADTSKKMNASQSISVSDMFKLTSQIEQLCPSVYASLQKESKKICNLKDKTGVCRDCSDERPFEMDLADISKCESVCSGKKKRFRSGQFCLPKKCPAGKPLMDKEGKCHSCGTSKDKLNVVSGYLACRNRFVTGGWSDKSMQGLQSSLKSKNSAYNRADDRDFSNLLATSCPSAKPILDNFGVCRSCDEPGVIDSLSGCDKCSSREITKKPTKPFTYFYGCKLKKEFAVKASSRGQQIASKTEFDGESTGVIYQYDRNQNLLREYHTIKNNPNLDLIVKHYHPNGKLWQEIPFNNRRYNGVLKIYDKDGILTDAANFNNGVQEGILIKYHPNGQVWQEVPFVAGKADGEVLIYDESGELMSKKVWKEGKLVQ